MRGETVRGRAILPPNELVINPPFAKNLTVPDRAEEIHTHPCQ